MMKVHIYVQIPSVSDRMWILFLWFLRMCVSDKTTEFQCPERLRELKDKNNQTKQGLEILDENQ